jgi:3-hydroxyisobutyrate dehydrogenase
VWGYDPDISQVSRFNLAGGKGSADGPYHVPADVDAVITMLPNAKLIHNTLVDSVMPFARKPVLFIDCSTTDIKATAELAELAAGRGYEFIDAPVSGGFEMAEAGLLSFMVGGQEKAVEQARPLFDAMGSRTIHFGPASSGQAVKACNNMVIGISMLALCEGFALAERLGLDQHKILDLWMNAGVRSWLLENRCPAPGLLPNVPSSNDYKPGFASALMVKDLQLAQRAAEEHAIATPLGAQALKQFKAFVEAGNGEVDFSGIYRTYTSR